jgi:phosphatidylglycerophosphate synthase
MYTLNDVKLKSKKGSNDESHKRLYFFASHFSIYFSWVFINLRLSADFVTGIFFATGLLGAVLFLYGDPLISLIAYGLWRLHIIFDLCDGEVARFTQKFSINGAYWDYMIHSLLYPLVYVSICIALYGKFNDTIFLIVGLFGSIVVSQTLSVKNNYYRAMLFNGEKIDNNRSANKASALKAYSVNIFTSLLNFEGLLLVYLILSLTVILKEAYLIVFLLYTASFLLQALIKFILFSKKGFYTRRS